jgi:hypothetical protein
MIWIFTRDSDIEGTNRLLNETPEDVPRRNVEAVFPADVHQSDEATLSAAWN